jgi:hypothetical protein
VDPDDRLRRTGADEHALEVDTGYVDAPPPTGFDSWLQALTELVVPEEPWDVRWPRVTDAVARLTASGGAVIREVLQDGTPAHVVMADPEGNEFCVV